MEVVGLKLMCFAYVSCAPGRVCSAREVRTRKRGGEPAYHSLARY
jgi:hypothetical protein